MSTEVSKIEKPCNIDIVIGSRLSPPWNNEACHVCHTNHTKGYVAEICPVIYKGKCFIEQANIAINKRGIFNYYPSLAYDTIREAFPELTMVNNCGTTEVYIKEFDRRFYFRQNYTEQYYIRL